MKLISMVSISLVAIVTSGCARAPTVGPGFEPGEREQRLWATTKKMSGELQASGKLHADATLQEYVQGVLNRLIGDDSQAYAPLKPRVFILDAPSINAFTFPHGDIYVHTGILGRMRNEAQLAMLLGHEITHATHRHTIQEQQDVFAKSGVNAYVGVLSALAGHYGDAISGLGTLMTVAAVTGYSREKEAEADREGLLLMARAKYDPHEGAEMFNRMLAATDRKQRSFNFFYSTHPQMQSRVESCERLAGKLGTHAIRGAGEVGQERYLAAMRPLVVAELTRHIAQGRYELAEETVRFLMAQSAGDAEALAMAGDLYRARRAPGDVERAETAYKRALETDADQAAAHRGLGVLYGAGGQRGLALEHLRKYIALQPTAPDVEYVRSFIAQLEQGR